MRNSDKNKILHFIKQQSNVETSKFTLTHNLENDRYKLEYGDCPLYFMIREASDEYGLFDYLYLNYDKQRTGSGWLPRETFIDVSVLCEKIKKWIDEHLIEYLIEEETPDLWTTLQEESSKSRFISIDFSQKDDFSEEEIKQVQLALTGFQERIFLEFEELNSHSETVLEHINYLRESLQTKNKFDWKSIAIAIVVSLGANALFDPDKAQELMNCFVDAFRIIPLLTSPV